MTIRTTSCKPDVKFTEHNILCATRGMINAIACAAMEQNIESALDIYADGTRQSIESDLGSLLRGSTLEFLENTIEDLKKSLLAAVAAAEFTVKVRGLDYSSSGTLDDIKIDFHFTPAE